LLTKITDFGHFILLDAGFCPQKFSICLKNDGFARIMVAAAPQPPVSYAYGSAAPANK